MNVSTVKTTLKKITDQLLKLKTEYLDLRIAPTTKII